MRDTANHFELQRRAITESSGGRRSGRWFEPSDLRSFGHRSRAMQMGYTHHEFRNRPIIAIISTWSDLQPCHSHFKQRVDDVKRGVLMAGGLPVELPAMSLSENLCKPTAMLYRNFLAMETEELIRSHPVDGVVLMGGCDKTTPGLLLGAISMDVPAIFVPAGPMLRGMWEGKILGSGSDNWRYWDELRAGNISPEDWQNIEAGIARSPGTCMTMGTASTMTAVAEAIGLVLPGGSSILAADSNHIRLCSESGRQIVGLVERDIRPSRILVDAAFRNAIVVTMALGGSTNAILHLIALARRAGLRMGLDEFAEVGRGVPVICNVRPVGDRYLMEDFYYAGGIRGVMHTIRGMLDLSCVTVTGRTLGENLAGAKVYDRDVIRPLEDPVYSDGSLAILRGNIAPDGCVIKPAAMDPRFVNFSGPALVFDDYGALRNAVDDDLLDITEDHVMILRNAGPLGGPGMPEWGMLPIPRKLLRKGCRDMLRISDARMSGTSYGACVLHVSPEAYVGGPLAFVETGDIITIDVRRGRIDVALSTEEMGRRRARWVRPAPRFGRGYGYLYSQHVVQADEGCDFDFLRPEYGDAVDEPVIF